MLYRFEFDTQQFNSALLAASADVIVITGNTCDKVATETADLIEATTPIQKSNRIKPHNQ